MLVSAHYFPAETPAVSLSACSPHIASKSGGTGSLHAICSYCIGSGRLHCVSCLALSIDETKACKFNQTSITGNMQNRIRLKWHDMMHVHNATFLLVNTVYVTRVIHTHTLPMLTFNLICSAVFVFLLLCHSCSMTKRNDPSRNVTNALLHSTLTDVFTKVSVNQIIWVQPSVNNTLWMRYWYIDIFIIPLHYLSNKG